MIMRFAPKLGTSDISREIIKIKNNFSPGFILFTSIQRRKVVGLLKQDDSHIDFESDRAGD